MLILPSTLEVLGLIVRFNEKHHECCTSVIFNLSIGIQCANCWSVEKRQGEIQGALILDGQLLNAVKLGHIPRSHSAVIALGGDHPMVFVTHVGFEFADVMAKTHQQSHGFEP